MAQPHWILSEVALTGTAAINNRIRTIEQMRSPTVREIAYEGVTEEMMDGAETLASLLLTTINGDGSLPVQSVTVEYIRAENSMQVPYYLAMSAVDVVDPVVPLLPTHALRYRRISTANYAMIKKIVTESRDANSVRVAVDALPLQNPPAPVNDWWDEGYYMLENGNLDTMGRAAVIFAILSQALLFNCDIRDVGILLRADMRMVDSYWAIAKDVPVGRLDAKLHAYSRQVIAALNLPACNNVPMGAWMRAYGIACGILPSRDSQALPEYRFVAHHPNAEDRTTVTKFETEFSGNLHSLCLNLIAVFGLLHLNKDHTYKSNEPTMARICLSFLRTIRTMIDAGLMTSLENSMEVICRTAPHPFGLGQTYAVAKIMYYSQALAPALAIRINVCPPGVQRFMIARAAMQEWSVLSVGRLLNASMDLEKSYVDEMCAAAEANPPAFSGLFRLYGIDPKNVGVITREALDGVGAVMPIAVGFAESQHTTSDNQRDGLALAMSIANVKRDASGLVSVFASLWDKYFDETDKEGLQKMVEETVMMRRKLGSSGVV